MALVRGGSIGLGAKAMADDFGQHFGLDQETHSSAATGVATRRGVGKIRHLHSPLLWSQRRVANRVADLEGQFMKTAFSGSSE